MGMGSTTGFLSQHKGLSVYGIYPSKAAVESAVDALRESGFRSGDISVLFPSPESIKKFAHEKATKAPEASVVGGVSGALLGGTLGWLAGIGSIAIPGVGPFIAAGPIMGALAGIGAGGTIGGLTGALVGLGLPEYEAKRYEGRVKEGGILLSVHADDAEWRDRAREILERTGGQDIASSSEGSGDYGSDRDRPHVANF